MAAHFTVGKYLEKMALKQHTIYASHHLKCFLSTIIFKPLRSIIMWNRLMDESLQTNGWGFFIWCGSFRKLQIKSSSKSLLKLRSSRAESNWRLRATCAKTAAPTWYAEAIWTLLLFWSAVVRSGQLDSALDERSSSFCQKMSRLGLNIWQKFFKNPEK